MQNKLCGDLLHHRLIPALAFESFAEAASGEQLGVAFYDSPCDKNSVSGIQGQRQVAGNLAEDLEELIDSADCFFVGPINRRRKNFGRVLLAVSRGVILMNRPVNILDSGAGDETLLGHAFEAGAQ